MVQSPTDPDLDWEARGRLGQPLWSSLPLSTGANGGLHAGLPTRPALQQQAGECEPLRSTSRHGYSPAILGVGQLQPDDPPPSTWRAPPEDGAGGRARRRHVAAPRPDESAAAAVPREHLRRLPPPPTSPPPGCYGRRRPRPGRHARTRLFNCSSATPGHSLEHASKSMARTRHDPTR
eukprot:scaffold1542_cov402-Prasinococcus_capsulatus_cf.AAC.7